MTTQDQAVSSLFEEDMTIDFNPLEEFAFDDEGRDVLAEGPYSMPDPSAVPQFQRELVSFENHDTADERIEALFGQMPTMNRLLFSILARCTEPVASDELADHIQEASRHHHSVYAPLTLCGLLERAGAIVQTDGGGTPLRCLEQEPLRVVLEGVEFWRPAPAPEVFWSLTEEGRAHLDSYRPLELIARCFAEEPRYTDVLATCLRLCAQDGGASLRSIGDVVDDEPVLQNPKRYAMYFIDKLEHAAAVEWKGQWIITDAGRQYLESLEEE